MKLKAHTGSDAKLFLFDIDGTIVNRDSTVVYPEAFLFFARTSADVAFITNQGSPACHDAGWDFSEKFPSLEQVEERLAAILASIPFSDNYGMYISYSYTTSGGLIIVPKPAELAFCANIEESWRKPNPGMILRAMEDYQVQPHECLMVGDRDEDRLAAEAAGVAFVWADKFFREGEAKRKLRLAAIAAGNLLLFAMIALKQGIWPHLWPSAWRGVQADHLAMVRKEIWEQKKAGRIREDRAGRLWSSRPKD